MKTPKFSRRAMLGGAAVAGGATLLGAPFLIQLVDAQVAPVDTAQARNDDIAYFREHFFSIERSYSAAARSEANSRLDRLQGDPRVLDQSFFELELARIVALADNGHTSYFWRDLAGRSNHAGIRLVVFEDEVYVLRAKAPNLDLLGARLIAIEGQDIEMLRTIARSLAGGLPRFRDRSTSYLFESPQLLHAAGVAPSPDAATYTLQTRQGDRVERRLLGGPAPEIMRTSELLLPFPADAEWRSALTLEAAPWSLQAPDGLYRYRTDPQLDAIIVQLRRTGGDSLRPIRPFINEVAREAGRAHPRNLVLDMRCNPGGDLTSTRDFMTALPTRIEGRIFVLTSPWTFSAAISSVGYLKQAAPERVTIVGEPIGDRLRFFAEGPVVTLPRSGVRILAATERHDYLTGCRGFDDCFRGVVIHPISVPTLDPEISAPWAFEAYLAGRDPGMEAVVDALQ